MLRIAILAAFIALTATPREAHAATAYLVTCTPGQGVTGAPVWIGVYDYFGKHVTMAFTDFCPSSIEVR